MVTLLSEIRTHPNDVPHRAVHSLLRAPFRRYADDPLDVDEGRLGLGASDVTFGEVLQEGKGDHTLTR